jgi:hypothetical protein
MYVLTFKNAVYKTPHKKVTIVEKDRSSSLSSIADDSRERVLKPPCI